MNLQDLRTLLDYNYWARDRMYEVLDPLTPVNHASYHRGQVTSKLRQLGAQPAKSLDLIAFYRAQGSGHGG